LEKKLLDTREYSQLMALGILLAVTVVCDIVLSTSNQALESEVSARGRFIQQTAPLGSLYKEMVTALADLSARNQDGKLQEVLTKNGLNLTLTPGRSQSPGQK
jgi:hypothetical protein